MTTFNASIPTTVAARVQGSDINIDVTKFHADSILAAFTYGVRRMAQDHVNAKAKEAKDAGIKFDAAACIANRIAAFESGELSTRAASTESFTAFDNALYDAAVKIKGAAAWSELATAWATSQGASTPERKRAILDTVAALDESRRSKLHNMAQTTIDLLAELDFDPTTTA